MYSLTMIYTLLKYTPLTITKLWVAFKDQIFSTSASCRLFDNSRAGYMLNPNKCSYGRVKADKCR